MFQVRIHGRGGQGVVTAAELLSVAAFDEGRYAQAFPSFGSERTGAPVVSYCRFSDKPIRTREPVMAPNAIIIQDVTLLGHVDLFSGMGPDGYVIINSSRDTSELGLDTLLSELPSDHYTICPATELALEHVGRALPNAALLGGFAALTGQLEISSVAKAIVDRFGTALGERNVAAAHAAYEYVTAYLKEHNNDVTKVGALQ